MVNLFFYWLIFGILFLALETLSPGLFFFISFFMGALSAAAASLYDYSLLNQIVMFFANSAIAFIILCFWFKKNIYGIMPKHGYKTNIFALQGKKAEVIEEIKPLHVGLIKVGGETWSAKCKDDVQCPVGAVVEVVDVIGCHCIVKLENKINF